MSTAAYMFRVARTTEGQPDWVADDTVCMFAPRPLLGTARDLGVWEVGQVSLDRTDPNFARFVYENNRLDATVLEFVTREQLADSITEAIVEHYDVPPEEVLALGVDQIIAGGWPPKADPQIMIEVEQ